MKDFQKGDEEEKDELSTGAAAPTQPIYVSYKPIRREGDNVHKFHSIICFVDPFLTIIFLNMIYLAFIALAAVTVFCGHKAEGASITGTASKRTTGVLSPT